MKFKNPTNGYTETVNAAFLWTLLFGTLYFAVRGVWTHVFASAVLAVLTIGVSWLIYPFFASSIIRKNYLRKGWTQVN
ncbi:MULTISPECIES: hypothetical protein [Methylobacter]